ncbi:hypothetical protein PZ897_01965 [Hoeflea sp. YIM 152468]|uniref:hypothetical protein n=1 Tax=Hoeflea sp. YIM 152468 TaxID=3031759 RepID=UPI0023DB430C|nr:hypothetical protein [Hoeflea sp. YIM 152468]MDF1606936.1 hypothetical protein [Hoeflea sp. YIM 152468]
MLNDIRFIIVDKVLLFCLWLAPEGHERTILATALLAYFKSSVVLAERRNPTK